MFALLAGALFALEGGATSVTPQPPVCPTRSQIEAELERMGEGATLARLGPSEVMVDGGTLRIVLRDRTGAALGVRQVAAPAECAKRVSLAAVLLAAWANAWDQTALAAAPPPPAATTHLTPPIELGMAAGVAVDGDARTGMGSLIAGISPHPGLALAIAADIATRRQVAVGPAAATYLVARLGPGLTVRAARQVWWADASLIPQLTRVWLNGKNLMTPRASSAWGASMQLRARVGARWGRLAPFVSLAVNRALVRERLTLDDATDSTLLSAWDVGVAIGLSLFFGGPG